MAAFTKFEVYISRDQRWVLDKSFKEEGPARAHAQAAAKDGKLEGVRLVRERRRADGGYDEDVLIETLNKGNKKKDHTLAEVSSAPACETVADLYKPEARTFVSRLLVRYLDDVVLTPIELLHHYRDLKRLLDQDVTLVAVDKVSSLQAAQSGTDSRERRDALADMLDQALARARTLSERPDLPRVAEVGFAEAVRHIDAAAAPEDRDGLALTALARELVDVRAFAGKIDLVLAEMARVDGGKVEKVDPSRPAPRPLALLDSALADCLAARGVLQEMIGTLPNLATLLARLMELISGRYPAAGLPEDAPLRVIARRIGAGHLREARSVIIDQFQRQLASTVPLNKSEPAAEFDVFRQLLGRLVMPERIFGGSATAEAMTVRYSRFLAQGGAVGRREAIKAVNSYLPTAMQQVRFLIALAETPLGHEQIDYVIETLEHLIGSAQRMEDLVGLRGTPKTRMQEIVLIYRFLARTRSLPARVCKPLADKLDDLVATFLTDNQVIEKLDNASDTLRVRALRLLQFCTSGVLTDGKATNMAKERVLAILRQPRFEETYTADVAPAEREAALREFHELLAKSNFLTR